MPTLIVAIATGPRAGEVSMVLEATQDPGRKVRENPNKWAFIYVDDADPEDFEDLLTVDEEPWTAAILASGGKPAVLGARRNALDLEAVKTENPGRANGIGTYRVYNDVRAFRAGRGAVGRHIAEKQRLLGGR